MKEIGITAADGNLKLNEYEMMIASSLVDGRSISTSWKDIAGLEDVVQELVETVILPIQKRDLFSASQLTQAPKGVLLHGPPGMSSDSPINDGLLFHFHLLPNHAGQRIINLRSVG